MVLHDAIEIDEIIVDVVQYSTSAGGRMKNSAAARAKNST